MSDNTTYDLSNTKLAQIMHAIPFLEAMAPDFMVQLETEQTLDIEHPRTPEDGDATRIFINYTNKNGNQSLYKFLNPNRMRSEVNIDGFLEDFAKQHVSESYNQTPESLIAFSTQTALSFSAVTALGLEEELNKSAVALAHMVLYALVSVLFDDPLDVVIFIRDLENKDTKEYSPVMTNIWRVKKRATEEAATEAEETPTIN